MLSITTKESSSAQIYSSGMQFAFMSENGSNCNEFVYCKDFFNDMIWSQRNGKPSSIYGFSYSPKSKNQVDLECTRMVISNKADKNFSSYADTVRDLLDKASLKLGFDPTFKVVAVEPKDQYVGGFIYVEADKRWMHATPILSLFTLLLRVGPVHSLKNSFEDTIEGIIAGKIKPYGGNDVSYLKNGLNGIKSLVDSKCGPFVDDPLRYYPEDHSIGIIHNAGIVAFSNYVSNAKIAPAIKTWADFPRNV